MNKQKQKKQRKNKAIEKEFSEHKLQTLVFDFLKLKEQKYPILKYIFAIPNGGLRNLIVAVKLKKEGVKKGVPDIFIPIPRKNFHGMFLELKVKYNKPSKEQEEFLKFLTDSKYYCVVCKNFENIMKEIENYLEIKF